MGEDGGSIPSRSDLLRRASMRLAFEKDRSESRRGGCVTPSHAPETTPEETKAAADAAWKTCRLTGIELKPGEVVCDWYGALYCKEGIVELLAARKGLLAEKEEDKTAEERMRDRALKRLLEDESFIHIQSYVRDVFEINDFSVPESNGRRFLVIPKCGHIVPERDIVSKNGEVIVTGCPVCGGDFGTLESTIFLSNGAVKGEELKKRNERARELFLEERKKGKKRERKEKEESHKKKRLE